MLEVTGEVNEFGANAYVDAVFVRNKVANTVFIAVGTTLSIAIHRGNPIER
jgi:hypothetical protein